MRIAVVGPGGVGGYFGGRLAEAGEEVVFLARGRTLEALRSRGLRVDSIRGSFHLPSVAATDDPAEIGPVDAVLLCVKAWQVAGVAPALAPMLGSDTVVVPLENGVEAFDELAAQLGASHVARGLCRIISRVVEPGHIAHEGAVPHVAFGERNGRPSSRLETLRDAFARAGVAVDIPANIDAAVWEKFLFIASIGGIGAVTRSPIGAIRETSATRELLEAAMREVLTLARARGVRLDEGVISKTLSFVDSLPASGTASMQRDIMEGRPSELESQNGAVVRLGREANLATPVHGFLYAALLPLELRARGEWPGTPQTARES